MWPKIQREHTSAVKCPTFENSFSYNMHTHQNRKKVPETIYLCQEAKTRERNKKKKIKVSLNLNHGYF